MGILACNANIKMKAKALEEEKTKWGNQFLKLKKWQEYKMYLI